MAKTEIFRAGTHTDNNGNRVTISAADLAEAVAAYDPALHEAPVVVGHPKTDDPAYGWVGGLALDGDTLSADFAQVDDAFADLVKAGRYKKISASFYKPQSPGNPKPGVWYLRHVGFLGAQPPAVKGLSAAQFAEGDEYVEFSEAAHGYAARLFRNLREFLIDKFGAEVADQTIPNWQIESIEELAAEDDIRPAFSDPPLNQPESHENKETNMSPEQQLAQEKAAREAAEAKATAAEAELARLKTEQEKDLRDAAHAQNSDFAESLVKEGRLKPADKDLVVQALDFAEHPEHYTADFGEGSTKKPLADAMRNLFAAMPVLLAQGHLAKGTTAPAGTLAAEFAEAADPEALSHHERALALAAKEGIDYAEAARRTAVV